MIMNIESYELLELKRMHAQMAETENQSLADRKAED